MPRNNRMFIPSNRSIPVPIRPAKEGERVAITIRGVGHTVCSVEEKHIICSVPRKQLEEAGYELGARGLK